MHQLFEQPSQFTENKIQEINDTLNELSRGMISISMKPTDDSDVLYKTTDETKYFHLRVRCEKKIDSHSIAGRFISNATMEVGYCYDDHGYTGFIVGIPYDTTLPKHAVVFDKAKNGMELYNHLSDQDGCQKLVDHTRTYLENPYKVAKDVSAIFQEVTVQNRP